jgi:uncharacterized protein (TIGR02147 family)
VNIFDFDSYREYLQAYVKRQETRWGVLTQLAKAADCHRPYLTKVLDGDAHLTSSHLYSLAKFWNFTDAQNEYLLRLLEIEKATQPNYRKYLIQKNHDLKRREQKLDRVVTRQTLQPEAKDMIYHSSWIWSAIHVATSIPALQTSQAIAGRLNLPLTQVESVLSTLQEWGSVKYERNRWKFAANEHHVPGDSPLATFHHSNWRSQAITNSQRQDPESLHYTVVQSVSREDYQRIRQILREAIQKTAKIAGPSAEETIFSFSCDLFEI